MSLTQSDYFASPGAFLAAFRRTENQENWCLVTHDDDSLTDFIRELHDGELPNDWRYDTIHWIASAIASEPADTDWDDIPHQYADNLTDQSTSYLFQWYADVPSRTTYLDDTEYVSHPDQSLALVRQLAAGQYNAIYSMVSRVLARLGLTQ